MHLHNNTYDQSAEAYARLRREWETTDGLDALIVDRLLGIVGDAAGLRVLDAGCGEGFIARILAERGADVTAMDVSGKLIEIARSRDGADAIDYHVRDLSRPMPEYEARFDLVTAHQVFDDVCDHRGFVATLGSVTRPGGRVVLSKNNPYSAVIREKVAGYFDSGAAVPYAGLASRGVNVYYFHRTLEDCVTAFRDNGFVLRSLIDVCPDERMLHAHPEAARRNRRFPYFMILEFAKSAAS